MKLQEYFNRIYIINLPNRTDRRKEMEVQLNLIGIDPSGENVSFFPAIRPTDRGEFPTLGTRGCFMSHLAVLRDAHSRGLDNVLILEDDLNFTSDFMLRGPSIIEALSMADWSIFYGGYELQRRVDFEKNDIIFSVDSSIPIVTAHFIAFRAAAILQTAQFLELLLSRKDGDPRGGPMHVDGAYNWFRSSNPGQHTLVAVPELGYQRKSRTDIHELSWFDKIPIVRSCTAVIRRLMNSKVSS